MRDEVSGEALRWVPWSNGMVEGHIHRLKLLKRQMYGRAGCDLLAPRPQPGKSRAENTNANTHNRFTKSEPEPTLRSKLQGS